jgi:cell division protein FtsZ
MNEEMMDLKREDVTTDEELSKLLEEIKVRIKIIGLGGSGCNTIARLNEEGIHGAELYAANTDAQHLLTLRLPKRILFGKKSTRGLGAGADPSVGEAAAKEEEDELRKIFENSHLVFLTCGLGGGTGTGSIPFVSQIAQESGALAIGFTTLPFKGEGKSRMDNALVGLDMLRRRADTVITIPNDKLLELVPRLPLNKAFRVADEVLMNSIKSITETITKPSMVNLDLNDIRTVMRKGGSAVIGLGESDSSNGNRAIEAAQEAINSPLLDADINTARGVIVNVTGPTDMSLKEAEIVMEQVQEKVSRNARIIWGANVDHKLDSAQSIKVILVATGVTPKVIGLQKPSAPIDAVR